MGRLKELKIPQRSPRRVGVVESDGRDKTRKVAIHFTVRHPRYGKYVRRRSVLHVHDQENASSVGDRVEVAECRPISKTKSWVLLRVLVPAAGPTRAALKKKKKKTPTTRKRSKKKASTRKRASS